jgi:hypothetical protein
MKRREFVEKVGMGSAIITAAGGTLAATTRQRDHHGHRPIEGHLANATVSFGAWPGTADEPLDRIATPFAPIAPNIHSLLPRTVTIKAGGAVNYIVAGFHQIAVYAPGTKPSDISTTGQLPIPMAPPEVFLIDDPNNRLFRGIDPRVQTVPQDRVEVVHFSRRGVYLVICTVSVHFLDDRMFGWVRVVR